MARFLRMRSAMIGHEAMQSTIPTQPRTTYCYTSRRRRRLKAGHGFQADDRGLTVLLLGSIVAACLAVLWRRIYGCDYPHDAMHVLLVALTRSCCDSSVHWWPFGIDISVVAWLRATLGHLWTGDLKPSYTEHLTGSVCGSPADPPPRRKAT